MEIQHHKLLIIFPQKTYRKLLILILKNSETRFKIRKTASKEFGKMTVMRLGSKD
jgi:hypothetical protein